MSNTDARRDHASFSGESSGSTPEQGVRFTPDLADDPASETRPGEGSLPDQDDVGQERPAGQDRPSKPVGKNNPPEHTRFRKGKSGNPRGRPRNSKNTSTILRAALNERVAVTENGRRRTCTKRQLMIAQAVNKAASGNLKAVTLVQSWVGPMEAADEARRSMRDTPDEIEQAIVQRLLTRMRGRDDGQS